MLLNSLQGLKVQDLIDSTVSVHHLIFAVLTRQAYQTGPNTWELEKEKKKKKDLLTVNSAKRKERKIKSLPVQEFNTMRN